MAKRVLIIDDDKELCGELSDLLRAEGFDTECAFHPRTGTDLLRKNTYDILLLDFKMPGMNGLEFLEQNREKAGRMKIFIISGSMALPGMLGECGLSALVAEVLNKPFDIEDLLRKIKE